MHRRTFLGAAFAIGAVAVGLACSHDDLKSMTVDQVAAKIAANDGHTYLFDANGRERYDESHLPGAKWIQYDGLKASDLPQDKGALLVFYCASEL